MGSGKAAVFASQEERPWRDHWMSRASQLQLSNGDGQTERYGSISTTHYLTGSPQPRPVKPLKVEGLVKRVDCRYACDYIMTHKAQRQSLVDFTASATESTLRKATKLISPCSVLGPRYSSDDEEESPHHLACICSGCTARSLRRSLVLGTARQSHRETVYRSSRAFAEDEMGAASRAWANNATDFDSEHAPLYTRRESAVQSSLHQRVASHLENVGLHSHTIRPDDIRYLPLRRRRIEPWPRHIRPSSRSLTSLRNSVVRSLKYMESSEEEEGEEGNSPRPLRHARGRLANRHGHAGVMQEVEPCMRQIATLSAEDAAARRQQRILDAAAAQKMSREAERQQRGCTSAVHRAVPLESSSEDEMLDELLQNNPHLVRMAQRRRAAHAGQLRLSIKLAAAADSDSDFGTVVGSARGQRSKSMTQRMSDARNMNTLAVRSALSSGALGSMEKHGKGRDKRTGRMERSGKGIKNAQFLTDLWDSD